MSYSGFGTGPFRAFGEARLNIETFDGIARAASRAFPRNDWRYCMLEYIQAETALVDAGFNYRPTWQLVDDLREAFARTNPAGVAMLIDEAYYNYFGRPKQEVATPLVLKLVAAA